jgi:hypothetical protein
MAKKPGQSCRYCRASVLFAGAFLFVCRELLQSEFVGLTGFRPRCKLNARFFHRKACHRSKFPTVAVWCREAMRHYDVQLRIRPPQRRV